MEELNLKNKQYCNGCRYLAIGNPPCHCTYYSEYREIYPIANTTKFLHMRPQKCIDECGDGLTASSKPANPKPSTTRRRRNRQQTSAPASVPKLPRQIPVKEGATLRILWLYRYTIYYDFDKWLHMEFVKSLKRTPGIDVLSYGFNLETGYPKLAPIDYNEDITLEKLHECFPFDVIICNTKSRMMEDYLPPNYPFSDKGSYIKNCWLPKDFKTFDCPKVMIEEDYHYELNDNWYDEYGFDLILQRHYPQALRQGKVKSKWFPFSVDDKLFKPHPVNPRESKVCFVGSDSVAYPHRQEACKRLTNNAPTFFSNHKSHQQVAQNEAYLSCLQKYTSYLNGSSAFDITAAKMFEIMSSGGLLFTNNNNNYGLQKLFPPESYITYEEDYSDLIQKAKWIVEHPAEVQEMALLGRDCIKTMHTHRIRIKQLEKLLKKEFNL